MPPAELFVTTPWPRSAKIVTIALLVLAIAGMFGTIIRWNADDTDTTAQAEIAQLTTERDELRVERQAVQAEANRLSAELGTTTDQLAALQLEQQAIADELAAAAARITELTARVVELRLANDTLTANSDSRIDQLTGRVIELKLATDTLEADLATVRADRDALAKLFPLSVEPVLGRADITGTYDATWTKAYNDGLATITLPNVDEIVISRTPEGWLRIAIPGVVTAGLARTDGALFTIVDSTTVVPAVNGTARVARVALTLYAESIETARDGSITIDRLGLSIAVSTPAVAGAPAGVALYGAELTPQS